jgi:hypothetical protein
VSRIDPRVAVAALAVLVAGAFAIILLTGGDSEPSPPQPTGAPKTVDPDDAFFGVNEPLIYENQQLGQMALADAHAAAIAASGIEWVRLSTSWRGEEPNPPVEGQRAYTWIFLDGAVGTLANHDLPVELTLFTTPNWAADDPEALATCGPATAPISSAKGLPSYAAAVAERYGPDGTFWTEHPEIDPVPLHGIEIWNEPNWNAFWCPEPEPARYADIFVESAKAVAKVDPDIPVITGGLTSVFDDDADAVSQGMDANEFMRQALEARPEIAKLADAAGFHPYDVDVSGVFDRIAKFRSGLDAIGMEDVPIEVNEAGWPTQGPAYAVDEGERASLTSELALDSWTSNCDVSGLALYAWRTTQAAPGASDLWYGISDPATAEPYETATAYADEISDLRASKRPAPDGGPCE